VVRSLHQTGKSGESKDGMDISLCILDRTTVQPAGKAEYVMQFAGANNPGYLITRSDEIKNKLTGESGLKIFGSSQLKAGDGLEGIEIRPDKMPIGFYHIENKPFRTQRITVFPGDCIYLFSDGYADQFGGPRGRKFKYSRLKEVLLTNFARPMHEQKDILEQTYMDWKGALDQVDDILLLGFRV
jgi:hypothetical protein